MRAMNLNPLKWKLGFPLTMLIGAPVAILLLPYLEFQYRNNRGIRSSYLTS